MHTCMQASLSNLIAKSQCAPAGNGRCYFVPEKTVSNVEAQVMRSETTGFACGKHNLSFRMWRQPRGTSFRLWKREGQPRAKNQKARLHKPGRIASRKEA